MTTIPWKNDGPVVLQPAAGSEFAVVASDTACCCPPEPERCWDCLDTCAYVFAVLEPEALAVQEGDVACVPFPSPQAPFNSVIIGFLYEDLFPAGTSFEPRSGTAYFGHLSSSRRTSVLHYGSGWLSLDADGCLESVDTRIVTTSSISYSLKCQSGWTTESPFYVEVEVVVRVDAYQTFDGLGVAADGCYGGWLWKASGWFSVPSTCGSYPDRQCYPVLQQFSVIDTPFTFTATGNDTTLGEYLTTEGPSLFGSPGEHLDLATTLGEALRDALTATFQITARESCAPVPRCCCGTTSVTVVEEFEACDGTSSPVEDPPIDVEDITIVVDWDGLTITLESPYFSGYATEEASFSCERPGEDPFDITERTFFANFFAQSSGDCVYFTSNINAFFFNPETYRGAQSNQIGPYVGECKLNAPVDETDTSCDFGESGFWCSDHPYANSVTVEMIIAP